MMQPQRFYNFLQSNVRLMSARDFLS